MSEPQQPGGQEQQLRDYLKRATAELRSTRRRLEELSEPIAIVGVGCRYPGGVSNADELWELVAAGRDAVGELPDDRGWPLRELYDPDPDRPGSCYVRRGSFLDAAGDFDAGFFGIGPREALAMDPQQRLLLEVAWEALENGGFDVAKLRGSRTGVFAGVSASEYGRRADRTGFEGYWLTGTTGSVVSGRVSYAFGFEGPAVSVDTACSSSLVALHLACQALRAGECSLALAGGVTVLSSPLLFLEFARQRGLALDGRCKSFADAADGVGWGEGGGLLVLARLSEALRDGRRVLAVIRGSAINQDGASNGLTAPNGPSQQRVIAQALANAGISPDDVDAVEAHGTGTALGDPIEAQALLATYGRDRSSARPLWLGSVKSNIGHTAAGAGVAGVIKLVKALEHGRLPRTLHVDRPSANVEWDAGAVSLLTEEQPWGPGERRRCAGVSSFGISGTNAHLIVEEAPAAEPADTDGERLRTVPWVLSARGDAALREQAARLRDALDERPAEADDVGCSLAARSALETRAVVVGSGRDALLRGLAAAAAGTPDAALVADRATEAGARVALLFSGQGAQRAGMGSGLRRAFPVFRDAFDATCERLDELLGRPLRAIVLGDEPDADLSSTELAQAGLFAVGVSLLALVRSWGVTPALVAGHSVGELAAAHAAGVLSLDDACRLVVARGRLMAELPAGGAMVSLAASEQEVRDALATAGVAEAVAVAAVNGPRSVVISGDERPALQVAEAFAARDVPVKRLRVSHAFHSARMDDMLDAFREVARGVAFEPPRLPVVSNVSGEIAGDGELLDPEYWVRHVREPVRFMDGVRAAGRHGVGTFLELGPGGVLSAMALDCLAADGGADGNADAPVALPALRGDRDEAESLLQAVGAAWARGATVDWARVFDGSPAARVPLPSYAFQRERYWLPSGSGGDSDVAAAGLTAAHHPFLGAMVAVADGGWLFTGRLSVAAQPWLADHAIAGVTLAPATAFLELALRAGELTGLPAVGELTLTQPLALPAEGGVELQVSVALPTDGAAALAIHARPEASDDEEPAPWGAYAQGTLVAARDVAAEEGVAAEWPPADARPLDPGDLYERLAARGFDYGPAFRLLSAAWERDGELLAEVRLGERSDASAFALHPALLDAALHPLAADGERSSLPFSWGAVTVAARAGEHLRVRCRAVEGGHTVELDDDAGRPVARVGSLIAREVPLEALRRAQGPASDALLTLRWQPLAPGGALADGAAPWVVGDAAGALASGLRAGGIAPRVHADVDALVAAIGADVAPPATVLVDLADARAADAATAHDAFAHALATSQRWLAQEPLAAARLVFVTRGAVAVEVAEPVDGLAYAPTWGLVRSALEEHPGRFALVDVDGDAASWEALLAVAARAAEEPQTAIRRGAPLAPRLGRVAPDADPPVPQIASGTVLVTGGTGALGASIARHLAAQGVGNLVLTNRSGERAAGAAALREELEALGARVRIVACDVADRERLGELVDGLRDELQGVVHAAGDRGDGVLASLDADTARAALVAKLDGAWHLHEATADLDLGLFALFSSAAATIGSPGQAAYTAANAFLDGLAAHRHARGLPALAIAWGPWDEVGMTAAIGEADRQRLLRSGLGALAPARALALFDRAAGGGHVAVVASALDAAALRIRVRDGSLPPVLSGLVEGAPRRTGASGASLATRLEGLGAGARERLVLDVVLAGTAGVLGHDDVGGVDADRTFKELGFDSLAAVELRNRLSAHAGLPLPPTITFDHPTPARLARHLTEQLAGTRVAVAPSRRRSSASLDEPVAIVGMACRYPGGVSSPEELWELVVSGRDGISEFPADRGWDVPYDPDPERAGCSYTRHGGFLLDAGDFDAGFFGIGPREALAMDPQQRLLLEVAWEALEYGGIDPASLRGSDTGVFTGVMYHDYGVGGTAPAELEGYLSIGGAGSVASGRLAYWFGLEGPAMTVDTACSSSLVALHLACQALRSGDCSMALAGGVTVMATPRTFVEFSRQRGLAPDGRCKSFAAGADGTGWAEGAGLLLVERLSDARRLGHRVLAVVRGSAVNQDGASNGLTAPSGPSQERVIAAALANAGVAPGDVDAVEAHGTGTTLGDPIEAQALLAAYGRARSAERPLLLGSVKSNLGHTQAAAGVAGVMKVVLALQHGVLPPTLHVDEPSPHVDWSLGALKLVTQAAPWLPGDRPRRAGVSSFGISGTNAHVIVEEAPSIEAAAAPPGAAGPVPWIVSARSERAVRELAGRLRTHVAARPELDAGAVGRSLALGRARLDRRSVVVGESREELLDGLAALAAGDAEVGAASGGGLAVLFTGQGSQRVGMGRELHAAFPVFAEAFDAVCEVLGGELGVPVRDVVFDGVEDLDTTIYTQAGLFAIEVALFRLVESFDLRPDALMGHSVGELVAAHVAGVLTLDDACRLVAARGRLMQDLPEGGAMVAIEVSEDEITRDLGDAVSLAGVNGPRGVVISGDERPVLAVAERWRAEGRQTKRLRVSHAFHSHRMEPMLDEFEQIAASLSFAPLRIPIVSNVTGEALTDEQAMSPAYWARHVREAVRFADGVAHLQARGVTRFIELGPDGTLTALAHATLADDDAAVLAPALRRDQPEARTLVTALGVLHAHGTPVDWTPVLPERGYAALPTYPFERERFWLASGRAAGDLSAVGLGAVDHPFLGAAVAVADGDEWLFSGRISVEAEPWLADHAVFGTVLLPGTAFVELAMHAGSEAGCDLLEELTLEAPLVLGEVGAVQLQVTVGAADAAGRRAVAIHARPDEPDREWTRHATGTLAEQAPGHDEVVPDPTLAAWPPAGAEPVDVKRFYERLAEWGFGYGPAFRATRAVWRRGDELFAEVALEGSDPDRFAVHPALLDAAFHASLDALADAGETALPLPFAWRGVQVHRQRAAALRVRLTADGDELRLHAVDADGQPAVSVAALAARPVERRQVEAASAAGAADALYAVEWTPLAAPAGATKPVECVAIVGDLGEVPFAVERYPDLAALSAALDEGVPAPAVVLAASAPLEPLADNLATQVREAVNRVRALLQLWLAEERLAGSRLVLVGEDVTGERPDLPTAAVWGLVRSGQSEHPGRFGLVDLGVDGWAGLGAALALVEDEPQLAVRDGALWVPRLVRVGDAPLPAVVLDPAGTVLVTGGTSGLGALVARHLVERHGVRRLLLASRRGPDADGVAELAHELGGLGCEVVVQACDVADRVQLAELLAAIPADRPLTAVVHAAGASDNALVEWLTAEQVERVLRPKVDGALNLHELTRESQLAAFVLFSSVASTLGGSGQGNYAAANAALDALARVRRTDGLAAVAQAWGLWAERTAETRDLDAAELERFRAQVGATLGVLPLPTDVALELFDRTAFARAEGAPVAVPARLDLLGLRERARDGALPAILRGLVRAPRRADPGPSQSLSQRLAAVPEGERRTVTVELVKTLAAAVLGHASPEAVEEERAFRELGFDSLGAVELRNRLTRATGLRLPSTLVFDHPTPAAVADLLLASVGPTAAQVDPEEAELRALLATIPLRRLRKSGMLEMLRALSREDEPAAVAGERTSAIDEMDLESLVRDTLGPGD